MLTYPHFNPIAIAIGPLQVHWYGIAYLFGFMTAWALGSYRAKQSQGVWTSEQVSDLIFYCALGVIVGGRMGYMLFYDLPDFLANPLVLFKIWQGGMAFHGGLLGVAVAIFIFCKQTHKDFFTVADFIAPLVPIGLGAGRLGNFVNGELWGRVTTSPWGMVFPTGGPLPRYPSQLYEFFLEGVVLFTILWCYSRKARPKMAVSGLFLMGYGTFRVIAECFRQPDVQLGFLAFDWLTMGQLLSVPMFVIGFCLFWRAHRRQHLQQGSKA
jgi:phosphatidylglycerol---prolipoprotein diacylglyceryl transferase